MRTAVEEKLSEKIDHIFTIDEFNSNLSDPHKRIKHIDRLQKRAMNKIRPRMQDLQDNLLTREAARDIETAIQNAQDET